MDYLLQCTHKVPASQITVHIITHHRKIRNHFDIYKHLHDWIPNHLYWICDVGKDFLGSQGLRPEDFANNLISPKIPLDELGLIVIVHMYHTHFGVILKDKIWSTEYDNSSKYCKFFLMYQGGVSFMDTVTGNWNMPSPPPLLLTIDDDVQEEAVNLVGEQADPVPANTTSLLPLDMRNKNESEPDVKKDSDQKVDYLQMDLNANTEPKKDCDQQGDYLQVAPEQKTDLDDGPSKPKVDSEVDLTNKPSLKMECSSTATNNRSSRPHKRMSPSSRCLRSSGSVCNKKPNKEAIWLYAELFSVITITDSHDKIYTTSGLFFPIQPKVW